ncbi:MAG: ribonuclease HI family protein [Minisyncoccia bacterium]
MDKVTIYTDGGARGNPGPAGAGAVIHHDGKTTEIKQFVGEHRTNNWAEYEAVEIALGRALELGLKGRDIDFKLDSQLIVEQMKGNYKIKDPGLKEQAADVHSLLGNFGTVTFTHIPREENKEADRLVNEAIDEEQVSGS